MKYVKPKSVTWWSGLLLVAIPVARYFGVPVPENLEQILVGTGLVGLRSAKP